MVAVSAFHAGKAIAQVAAVQVPVDDLPEVGTEESIGPLKSFFVILDEGFQMILDASIIKVRIRISEIGVQVELRGGAGEMGRVHLLGICGCGSLEEAFEDRPPG